MQIVALAGAWSMFSADTLASPATVGRYLPQKLHRACFLPGHCGYQAGLVLAAWPEPITISAASTHPSQMYAPGPAMSFLTLFCGLPAEGAGQQRIGTGLAATCPAAGPAGLRHDLVYPLVAEPERGGELTQRRALQVQAAHRPVEFGPGDLRVTLGIDQPFLGSPGLGEQVVVHLSTVTRRGQLSRSAGCTWPARGILLNSAGAYHSGHAKPHPGEEAAMRLRPHRRNLWYGAPPGWPTRYRPGPHAPDGSRGGSASVCCSPFSA